MYCCNKCSPSLDVSPKRVLSHTLRATRMRAASATWGACPWPSLALWNPLSFLHIIYIEIGKSTRFVHMVFLLCYRLHL